MGFRRTAWFAFAIAQSMAGAATAPVRIQVYDYASIHAAPLGSFVDAFDQVLRQSGLDAEVTVCRGFGAVPCENDDSSPDPLIIRILAGDARHTNNVRRRPLGQSMAGPMGGVHATVFLSTVRDQA